VSCTCETCATKPSHSLSLLSTKALLKEILRGLVAIILDTVVCGSLAILYKFGYWSHGLCRYWQDMSCINSSLFINVLSCKVVYLYPSLSHMENETRIRVLTRKHFSCDYFVFSSFFRTQGCYIELIQIP
jgi:hypothetical protein